MAGRRELEGWQVEESKEGWKVEESKEGWKVEESCKDGR